MIEEQRLDSVVITVFDDPLTCDPHVAYDSSSQQAVLNVYEPLLRYNARRRRVSPHLALEVPQPADGPDGSLGYFFPVRRGVKFHDGSTMTEEDVLYSLRRAIVSSPEVSVLWTEALLGQRVAEPTVDHVAAACEQIRPRKGGVEVALRRPFLPFLNLVAHWSLVLPKAWATARGEWDGELDKITDEFLARATSALYDVANGTGPFSLAEWDRSSRFLRFQRHDGYWGPVPSIDRVVLVSEDDRVIRERSLFEGKCDFAVCQPESLGRLRGAEDLVIEEVPDEWLVTPLGLLAHKLDPESEAVGSGRFDGQGMPPDALSDWHLRRALALSFDYEAFTEEALNGKGISHYGIFPRASLDGGPLPDFEFDTEKARDHLEKSWGGRAAEGGLKLIIYAHKDNFSRVRAAEILARGFNGLNPSCTAEVCELPLTKLVPMLYGAQCPVAWLGWDSDYNHPHDFAAQLLAGDSPLPRRLGIKLPRVRELLEEALNESSEADASAVYRAVAAEAIRDQTHLYVPGKVSYLSHHRRWQGVRYMEGVANVLDFASFTPTRDPRDASGVRMIGDES